ncbi:glucokinase-like ROK family protein [Virgibacillus natechei]|uniref:Glucokinase-like ROK family protein n=2 Tax=Virgibacillus natechei TaxID=1216297 RepID=A0ABS4IFR8_9BACI|nr:glucokinase-like ROK family protein [Virgibacillus natechei]
MNRTWNQHVVKKENKSLVLETIIGCSPISRADIANQTGLNKGTVSSLVNELHQEQLIYESGPGVSSGGRRPVMLLFKQEAGYSIGIYIGVNYILGILTDLQGEIYHERTIKFNQLTYEEITNELFQVIDSLISAMPPSHYGIVGIGIGVPGIISTDGQILLAPNLNWKNKNLKGLLEDHYHLPVHIENEANAGAYGEKRFGAGKDSDNIIYVSVGIGIGVGLILNGELYKGINGLSGELGHMTIEIDGLKCRCGDQGCWELYASEQALIKNAEQKLPTELHSNEDITLENLLRLSESGNMDTMRLFEEIGMYLGIGINNIINIFNPEQIIIGNRLASSEKWLKGAMEDKLKPSTFSTHHKDLTIDFSSLSTHSSAMGVAAFAVESFLIHNQQTH